MANFGTKGTLDSAGKHPAQVANSCKAFLVRRGAPRRRLTMGSLIPGPVATTLDFMVTLFVFVVGLGAAAVVVVFILDVSQTKDAIRRNFPVVGRFRTLFI